MSSYSFLQIEKKWQAYWSENQTFAAEADPQKPKFYALDMFPYPSGAGLHVGHPLGYIASDIVSRYKRLKGFNVLHPMGFDAFGLPAEQYAIETGQHPAITTQKHIRRYKEQLRSMGFSYDWRREVQTCDPNYYRWTQWIFIQLFHSWYDCSAQRAEDIKTLIQRFEREGNASVDAACDDTPRFTAQDWEKMDERARQELLLHYRLAYLSDATVNWCPALGTVLSNDEVKEGFSERGGYPVVRKTMKQWSMRITAYAERLLQGLDTIDWPEPLKEMQSNWIGKSTGAEMTLAIDGHEETITVFTTRIDTVFGLTFMVLAPELAVVQRITTPKQREAVTDYCRKAKNKSERERMTHVKQVSGVFTGAHAIHPFTQAKLPIWVADYVLAGYGTGAVMAVPGGDQRDYDFARHFDLPIVPIYEGMDVSERADPTKKGKIMNEGLLKGLNYEQATQKAIDFLEAQGIGGRKTNYRMRDAVFARQRYWGEPVPIYFKDETPYALDVDDLPLRLPKVDKYLPTEAGDPPLGRAKDFHHSPKGATEKYPFEWSTMPGWAGSSWYWYRYMDANNDQAFVSPEAQRYWQDVDLYIGGTEHATGHLLYSRFWNQFLYDRGWVDAQEPFKKLVNQGMIQGESRLVYRGHLQPRVYVSQDRLESDLSAEELARLGVNARSDLGEMRPHHVDVGLVDKDGCLDLEAFKQWRAENREAVFILNENGKYQCGTLVEKMSKSKHNVVNPDDVIAQYGADTLRMYEMFLGPLEQFKPWNTQGIEGVHKFLKKFWRLYHNDSGVFDVLEAPAAAQEQKIIHQVTKKIAEDVENLSLNTSVSALMVAVNELTALKCRKREVLEPLAIVLSPFAPHIAEEVWERLGHQHSISHARFPAFDEALLQEDTHEYPVSINGKVRTKLTFAVDAPRSDIEADLLADETVQKWLNGKPPKKIIIVPKRIINLVV